MSTTTTDNLALIKEGSDEPVRNHRSNANINMDAIDAAVKDLQDAIDNAKALLGALGLDGSGDPVVSKAEALATLGAAASSHNHAAGDITSGTLAIARGGTNAGTAAAARTNLDAAQDASSGTTLYAAQQAISGLAAAQGSVPSGKTLQGEIQTLQDSVARHVVTKTLTTNNYGNVDLGLYTDSAIVLYARRTGTNDSHHNLIPFVNWKKWCAYAVKNTQGTSLSLEPSGTTMDVEICYIDKS